MCVCLCDKSERKCMCVYCTVFRHRSCKISALFCELFLENSSDFICSLESEPYAKQKNGTKLIFKFSPAFKVSVRDKSWFEQKQRLWFNFISLAVERTTNGWNVICQKGWHLQNHFKLFQISPIEKQIQALKQKGKYAVCI